jgi:ribosomal protein S18 acetylase RimI-like enzyme
MLACPNHIIRSATRADLPDLSVIIAAAFETYRGLVPDRLLDLYIAYSADIAQQYGRGEILLLESRGEIAGSVVHYADAVQEGLGLPSGWAGIRTLAVHCQQRSRGFGRSLVEACIARSRNDGAPVIALHTAGFMRNAVALYRSLGFTRCPEHDLLASAILGFGRSEGDVLVTAYALDLRAGGAA